MLFSYAALSQLCSRLRPLLLLVLLAEAGAAQAQRAATFNLAAKPGTGSAIIPTSITVADVNGDGKLDLLTTGYNSGTAVVLLGAGAGNFGPATQLNIGGSSQPTVVKVADVNGDSRPDLLLANYGNSAVGVLLGTGAGNFGPATQFSTGAVSRPYALAVADVNGDGKLDLLTANYSNNTVGVLLGMGTGSFGPVAQFSTGVGSNPIAIAVADVNGDGKLDLLTVNQGTSTAGVLLGTGTGSFGTVTQLGTGGSNPTDIAVADVNGDGKLDLLATDYSNNTVGLRLATSTGFGPATTFGTGAGSSPNSLAVADVNGDGKLDLLTANYNSNMAGVLLGTGTGSFGTVTQFGTGGNNPVAIAVADVNADGAPDLLTANSSSSSIAVLLNTTSGLVMSTLVSATAAGASLSLFPNPAPGATTLTGAAPGAAVRVLDALGRVAATATADARGIAALGKLAPGFYLVRAGSGSVRLAVE